MGGRGDAYIYLLSRTSYSSIHVSTWLWFLLLGIEVMRLWGAMSEYE